MKVTDRERRSFLKFRPTLEVPTHGSLDGAACVASTAQVPSRYSLLGPARLRCEGGSAPCNRIDWRGVAVDVVGFRPNSSHSSPPTLLLPSVSSCGDGPAPCLDRPLAPALLRRRPRASNLSRHWAAAPD